MATSRSSDLKKNRRFHLVLDIGGTWIKAAVVKSKGASTAPLANTLRKALPANAVRRLPMVKGTSSEFGRYLADFVQSMAPEEGFVSAAISTTGIIDTGGTRIEECMESLSFLRNTQWKSALEGAINGPVVLVNDAEAFMLGAAILGYTPLVGTAVCLVIGTGLGSFIVRDGRRWLPHRRLPLVGSIGIPGGTYNSLLGADRLASLDSKKDLSRVFASSRHRKPVEQYWRDLAGVIHTVCTVYDAERILLGGGVVSAAENAGVDIPSKLAPFLATPPPGTPSTQEVVVVKEGNRAQLIGAAALAVAARSRTPECRKRTFDSIETEALPGKEIRIDNKSSNKIIDVLMSQEVAAAPRLDKLRKPLARVVDHLVEQWPSGGRLVYVGAGTSGRLAALDAVEIPCTFGLSRDRVLAIVAGGLPEAALTIEGGGAEDISSVPDMILLRLKAKDTVVGISASGSANFVFSALSFASNQGARTVLLHAGKPRKSLPWDHEIAMDTGPEVIAGSTRMKAGTATKQCLNFLSTTLMVRLGLTRGPHMIHLACLNDKLLHRATRILSTLFNLDELQAHRLLQESGNNLAKAVATMEKK